MARRGRHAGGHAGFAITFLIAATAMTAPLRAHADVVPVSPSTLAQADVAVAQHAIAVAHIGAGRG